MTHHKQEPSSPPAGGSNTNKAYLTLPEVAEHYRTTEATVRYWRLGGSGPRGVKVGTRVLYPISEIERYDQELARQLSSTRAS